MALTYPTLIFAEGDIENPVQAVFDSPVTTGRLGEGFRQMRLIVFDGQQRVASSFQYLLRYLRLTAQGIDRDDTAFEAQRVKKRFDPGEFLAFALGSFLSKT